MGEFITKRRSPRRSYSRTVGVLHRGVYFATKSIEVGEGGMLVFSDHPMKEDDQIVLTFSIRGFPLVSTRASIRYEIKKEGRSAYGLQFKGLDLSYLRIIRRYVSQKTKEEALLDKERQTPKTYSFASQENGKPKPTVV